MAIQTGRFLITKNGSMQYRSISLACKVICYTFIITRNTSIWRQWDTIIKILPLKQHLKTLHSRFKRQKVPLCLWWIPSGCLKALKPSVLFRSETAAASLRLHSSTLGSRSRSSPRPPRSSFTNSSHFDPTGNTKKKSLPSLEIVNDQEASLAQGFQGFKLTAPKLRALNPHLLENIDLPLLLLPHRFVKNVKIVIQNIPSAAVLDEITSFGWKFPVFPMSNDMSESELNGSLKRTVRILSQLLKRGRSFSFNFAPISPENTQE